MKIHVCTILVALSTAGADELLVGSWGTHSIRRYDTETKAYLGDLVAPNGQGLSTPDGLAWRSDGVLIVASSDTNQVLLFDGTTGDPLGELVGADLLTAPGNLQIGPDGLLYVCNKLQSSVERFDAFTGEHVDTFVEGGGLVRPVGLEWHEGVLYVADFVTSSIFRYDAEDGTPLAPLTTTLPNPLILRVDKNGDLLVTSHLLSSVEILDLESGDDIGTINGGPINCPVGHVDDPDGNLIVASWGNHRILRYDADYTFVDVFAFGQGLVLPNDLLLVPGCDADCNGDGALNVLDFVCFQLAWQKQSPDGDCDANGEFNVLDFVCYQSVFTEGCE